MATLKSPPIPRRIRVGKKLYSIEVVEAMLEKKNMGKVCYPQQTIKLGLKSNVTGRRYRQEEVQDTFWHELTHAILHDMGRDTLNRDEKFVTGFANRLTQAINSARFE
jgi:predicted SprT family Zn-dependent metalloprotease